MLRERLREVRRAIGWGGWMFTDAQFVWAHVEVNPKAVRAHLPCGLRLRTPLGDAATVILFFAYYPHTSFGSVYSEAGLLVPVWHGLRPMVHCPWMLVDDDIALIAGRELLGYPKKMGDFDLSFEPNHFKGVVHRRGVPLLKMRATLEGVDPSPPPLLGQHVINVRGPLGLATQRLVVFKPRELILDARMADASIEVLGGERDPLRVFEPGRVREARYYRINIGGRVPPRSVRPVSLLFSLRNWALRYT